MNELQKAYCDGAAMAYRDAADKLAQMLRDAPESVKDILKGMKPFETVLRFKSEEVYRECERFMGIRQ